MVAALQFGQHQLVGLGPLLLGTDQQEPENDEHQDQRQELHQHVRAAGRGSSGLGRAQGTSDGFKHSAPPLRCG